jgi:hypothetical protein
MAIKFNRSQTFATNGTVTAAGLHNLIDGTDIYQALITDQTAMTSVGSLDKLLIADSDLTAADAPRSVTVNELFEDALTLSTYTNANAVNLKYTSATGNYTLSTGATITNGTITNGVITNGTITNGTIASGTIPTLTAGTTTSTNAVVTNGTVQTLTASTGTIGTFNSTTGTIGTIKSTTGTITNLSTTLAGDFTISQGTATLATSGATAGTYGSVTAIPFLTVDAKGRITSATTGTFSSTPPAGSVTFNTLSTSTTESDNVAKRTAKAWVNFNGVGTFSPNPSTSVIRSAFNVSSITKIGTGNYSMNFATAMADANYSAIASYGTHANPVATLNMSSYTTSSVQFFSKIFNGSTGGNPEDSIICSIVIFGN